MPLAGYEAAPRYRELVERVLGEDVDFLPPGFSLDGDADRIDWMMHKREFIAIAYSGIIGAAAANAGFYSLNNASVAPSRLVGTFEGGMIRTTTATTVLYRIDSAIIGNPAGNIQYRDGRVAPNWSTSKAPPVRGNAGNANGAAPGGLTVWVQQVVAATYTAMNLPPFVVAPGTAITVHPSVVNEIFEAAFFYRFRAARPEEFDV